MNFFKKKMRNYINKEISHQINNEDSFESDLSKKIRLRSLEIAENISDEEINLLAMETIRVAFTKSDWLITHALDDYLNRGDIVQVIVKMINDSQIKGIHHA